MNKKDLHSYYPAVQVFLISVSYTHLINMAGAFEKPVRAGNEGYVANSAKALAAYADETYRDFAAAPELSLTVGKGLESLAEPCSVDALLNTLEAWLKGEIK